MTNTYSDRFQYICIAKAEKDQVVPYKTIYS